MIITVRVTDVGTMKKLDASYGDIKPTNDPEEGCLAIGVSRSNLAQEMLAINKTGAKILMCSE